LPTPVEFPLFNIKAGYIEYIEQERQYKIEQDKLQFKFTINGKKKIIFSSGETGKCGVIIESNFQFSNNFGEFNFMVAYMAFQNKKSFIIFNFFQTLDECYSELYGENNRPNFMNSTAEILSEYYIIPFNEIAQSTDNKPILSKDPRQIQNTQGYIESRNRIKFLDKFARSCQILIPTKIKINLLENVLANFSSRENNLAAEFANLRNNIKTIWPGYTETESRRTSFDSKSSDGGSSYFTALENFDDEVF